MDSPWDAFLITTERTMNKPALEIINTEYTGKTYIDSKSAQVIIDMIADLKKKVANAEELLEMMDCVPRS